MLGFFIWPIRSTEFFCSNMVSVDWRKILAAPDRTAARKLIRTKVRAISLPGKALLAEDVFERVCREAWGSFPFILSHLQGDMLLTKSIYWISQFFWPLSTCSCVLGFAKYWGLCKKKIPRGWWNTRRYASVLVILVCIEGKSFCFAYFLPIILFTFTYAWVFFVSGWRILKLFTNHVVPGVEFWTVSPPSPSGET